jgi:hypothetical protein
MRIRLAVLVALIAAPAFAAEPDAPVATAQPGSPPTSTAEQIDAFIKSSPAREARRAEDAVADGVVPGEDRKPHGEVGVAVGTGGYRSVYGRTEIPVGKNGRVSLAFEDTKGGYYGYGRRGYYGGPYVGGPLGIGSDPDRQRCDLEGMSAVRPLDTMGGPNGRCVRPFSDW